MGATLILRRNYDWHAWLDSQEEDGPQGHGFTREAAIKNFVQLIEDE
jgi:hypothetical protein